MKTTDIEKLMGDKFFAVNASWGREYLGSSSRAVQKAKVVATRQERKVTSYTRRGNTAHDGVKVELVEPHHGETTMVIMPKDVLGTWERHEELQRRSQEAADSRRRVREELDREFDTAVNSISYRIPGDQTLHHSVEIDRRRRQVVLDTEALVWLADRLEEIWDQVAGG